MNRDGQSQMGAPCRVEELTHAFKHTLKMAYVSDGFDENRDVPLGIPRSKEPKITFGFVYNIN